MARRGNSGQNKKIKNEEESTESAVSEEESSAQSVSMGEGEEKELNEIVENTKETESEGGSSSEADGDDGSSSDGDVSEETGSGSAVEDNDADEGTMRTVFVKGIDYDNRESDIKEQMEKIGPVSRVNVPLTYDGRRNKGFAYVEFKKMADAQKALKLNQTVFLGRKVIVDQARSRSNFKIYTVFCKNLSFETRKEDITGHFSTFGEVYNVTLPMDTENEGRNKGFCFVEYKDEDAANKAVNEREHVVHGRSLYVSLGKKNDDRNVRRSSDRLYGKRNYNDDREGGDRRGGYERKSQKYTSNRNGRGNGDYDE